MMLKPLEWWFILCAAILVIACFGEMVAIAVRSRP